jgi:tetratricopeptide (TPR) repeat protein
MAVPEILEAIPVAKLAPTSLPEAARLLDQALKIGSADPNVAYMLGVCYKRMGKTVEARNAFQKISDPDANIFLQLGLLSFAEKAYPRAEQEFARAWELNAGFFEAAYNLLLTRLYQGQVDACLVLVPQLMPLAESPNDYRFLVLLQALLACLPRKAGESANGDQGHETVLAGMTQAEETGLLTMLGGLNQFEIAYPLLRKLASLRPHSPPAQEAYLEILLVQAKQLADRCHWKEANDLLAPLGRSLAGSSPNRTQRPTHLALINLLGCCACMLQDFDQALSYFKAALKTASAETAWAHQNLALAYEWQGRLDQADTHWNRYFDLLDRRTPVPAVANYLETLAFEGINRLADVYTKKEKWNHALAYLQRAQRLRPTDPDVLERLFHLYNQLKRPEDARRTLRRLREVRPHDPQFELYELDVREVRTLEDMDRMLSDVRRTLQKHPGDVRVEERATAMAGNMISMLSRMSEQRTDQLNKIVDQMRRLPNYQINWPAVREVMRDLQDEFLKLRRITNKCAQLLTSEEQRRAIDDLTRHIDRKIELCHSLGG